MDNYKLFKEVDGMLVEQKLTPFSFELIKLMEMASGTTWAKVSVEGENGKGMSAGGPAILMKKLDKESKKMGRPKKNKNIYKTVFGEKLSKVIRRMANEGKSEEQINYYLVSELTAKSDAPKADIRKWVAIGLRNHRKWAKRNGIAPVQEAEKPVEEGAIL